MSKNKKSKNKKPQITKADGIAYERYLYFKLMVIEDTLEHIAKELLEIEALDMLETYCKNGITDEEFLMDMVEGMMEEDVDGSIIKHKKARQHECRRKGGLK